MYFGQHKYDLRETNGYEDNWHCQIIFYIFYTAEDLNNPETLENVNIRKQQYCVIDQKIKIF